MGHVNTFLQDCCARPSCLCTGELPGNYCNLLQSKSAALSYIGNVTWETREIATKLEMDEERCSKTLSCFPSEISQGYI